jgi:hypothetical protein
LPARAQGGNIRASPTVLSDIALQNLDSEREAPPPSAAEILMKAAAVLMMGGALVFLSIEKSRDSLAGWQRRGLAVVSEPMVFDAQSPNAADLQTWLKARGAPSPDALPAGLRGLDSLGCKTFAWNGRGVSIISFRCDENRAAHLVVISRRDVADASPPDAPRFARHGKWATASWGNGELACMLAMEGSESELRKLL